MRPENRQKNITGAGKLVSKRGQGIKAQLKNDLRREIRNEAKIERRTNQDENRKQHGIANAFLRGFNR